MDRFQKEEATIHHFSHDHPLQLMSFTQSHFPNLHTRCCGPPPSSTSATMNDPIYNCTLCNFSIHKSCSKLPRLITHPSHPPHPLTLLPLPAYLNGSFSCDACSNTASSGFSYHCSHCSFDLHTHCASLPLTVTHVSHPHLLSLSFLCPGPEKAFTCGICLGKGGSAWLYRCSPCGFAAHLHCARAVHPTRPVVSPSPATGVPVRPPTAPVRPSSQVFWGAGLTVPRRPMGPGSSLPFVGSPLPGQVDLTRLMCFLVGVPQFTGLGRLGGNVGPNGVRPTLLASFRGALGQGGGGGGGGGHSVGDGGGGYDCNLDCQSQENGIDAQGMGCFEGGANDFSGFDFGAVDFGGFDFGAFDFDWC